MNGRYGTATRSVCGSQSVRQTWSLDEPRTRVLARAVKQVDDDGDIVDKNGNVIGHAERWEPEQKERQISPMSGLRVNKEGEVRDKNGDVIGRLTEGQLTTCIGKEMI